jgi:hypothetical protein
VHISLVGLAIGDLAMGNAANGRLALVIVAAAFMLAAVAATPASACSATQGCPSNNSELQGVAANALPTYPEPAAETAAEPVKLKKFTKQANRNAKRAQPKKAQLAQRARAGKIAAAHQRAQDEAAAKATVSARRVTPALANANAQFVDAAAAKVDTAAPAEAVQPPQPAAAETHAPAPQPPSLELVSAEEFNDLDRAAWEANQMPKLMQLKVNGDSHAELRDDDSRWAQTSTIGKIFVAFGALLTLGSAIRMFMA